MWRKHKFLSFVALQKHWCMIVVYSNIYSMLIMNLIIFFTGYKYMLQKCIILRQVYYHYYDTSYEWPWSCSMMMNSVMSWWPMSTGMAASGMMCPALMRVAAGVTPCGRVAATATIHVIHIRFIYLILEDSFQCWPEGFSVYYVLRNKAVHQLFKKNVYRPQKWKSNLTEVLHIFWSWFVLLWVKS
jgi:hypothetical protein